MKIIECVPNFSEGKDQFTINQIAYEIESTKGIKLLNIDVGHSPNRSVFTFIGDPESILRCSLKCIKKALELIDLNKHQGIHPRIGAVDVFPLIPLKNVSKKECIKLAHNLGQQIGEKFKIPVYLYGDAAKKKNKTDLSYIRTAIKNNIFLPPDYGPNNFHSSAGIINVGVRNILIAFNVNLNTKNLEIAQQIAGKLRNKRNTVKEFRYLKTIGWFVEEYNKTQISLNLTNYRKTPIYPVFEEIKKIAKKYNCQVTGSEIVGLVPLKALLDVAKSIMKAENSDSCNDINISNSGDNNNDNLILKNLKNNQLNQKKLLDKAISWLNLTEIKEFDPQKKIIEYTL